MTSELSPDAKQSVVTSTSIAPKRPSRIIDLPTSVQAHLGSERSRNPPPLQIKGQASMSLLSSEAHTAPSLRIKGQGKPSLSSQSYPPSLFSRLSDTYLGKDSNPVTAALSSPSLSKDDDSHSRHLNPRNGDGGPLTRDEVPVQSRTFPLLPERMFSMNALSGLQDTQSRARDSPRMTNKIEMASPVAEKLMSNDGSSTNAFLARGFRSASNDSEGPNDNPHVDPGLTDERRMNGVVLGSDPRPSSMPIEGSHTSVSILNTRLFHKLKEEKRHLQDNNLSATLSNSEASGDVVVGRNSAVVTEPQAFEAKLRARAQLKMRLASEKRALALPKQT
ncbi:hypothetical protein J3R30DRAFT_138370 [Lentinula aciculospora]|uniref:Uncharacterized protein n=1 Tax=Lentinula aciculospora TaxID=153920 RepID=A0A9W9DY99_9AGAR|nr:hypothetical protein J3R30DRAFT_138370 [Lentinula aciculospora]